ncbi:hypothetical protein [Curvibacter sp. PAE-UM]|uniref:hypothetical protein n=1 Tax=Curvibacter sp. PAE-UM TaxID=1714344 RepID=UPI00070CD142|nr:hypothetical protein [Curvibacter sp. PAE-UM]KRH99005.1 hypothetical protein AO057_05950 [Curvibacter sp. PAE-UM]
MRQEELFGLSFSNIPTMNLRDEFNQTYAFVFGENAEQALKPPIKAIETPMFIWFGMPDDMFTLLLQRAILGVEAYLPFALKFKSAQLGDASEELFAKLDDPFSLGGKKAVTNIYHRMPAEVHPELSLQYRDKELYERTQKFYLRIRNPLFHGCELHDTDVNALRRVFDHVAKLYEWIDGWYDPNHVMKGFGSVSGIRGRHPKIS